MPKWARDFLVLPLLVGVIVAAFTIGLPWLLGDTLELTYEIEGPTRYLSDPAVKSIEVSVNGVPVSDIVGYRVHLENTGGKPIRDLPVRIHLEGEESEVSILAVSHSTDPKYEFGEIAPLESTANSRRFRYELLNGGDRDIITIVASVAVPIHVYAKAEGLEVIEAKPDQTFEELMKGPTFVYVSVIAALFAMFLQYLTSPIEKEVQRALRRIYRTLRKKDDDGG